MCLAWLHAMLVAAELRFGSQTCIPQITDVFIFYKYVYFNSL